MAQQDLDWVFLGGTGDLVMRKLLPALYFLEREGLLPSATRIIGVARTEMDNNAYRSLVRERCAVFLAEEFDEALWANFVDRIHYAAVEANTLDSYANLARVLNSEPQRERVFYLSLTPSLFTPTCANLAASGLITRHSRVVLEKPLGHDLASSRFINDEVGHHFSEKQIFRIDHYLGKEPVQNLLALRFGNVLFEPLLRREWVHDVQITVAEQIGVEGRGEFYENAGAMRDMVQNHLLQLLCIVAMEPPVSIAADAVRDEKLKVLNALRPIRAHEIHANTVRGQYRAGASKGQPVIGYLDEKDVDPDSRTETFVAIKAEIDTWRWAGVPFFLRTGKRLQERVAEIVINFREVPHSIFGELSSQQQPNRLVIRMQPEETVELHLLGKRPGDGMNLFPVKLNLDFAETFRKRRLEAYERLLLDVMRNNLTLFVRRDEQEAAWTWVEPIIAAWDDSGETPRPYTAGTWGPAASSALLSRVGSAWHEEN